MLHHNELITIEEETILNVPSSRNGMQRKFTLTNRGSKFSFGILSSGGSIVSIKVNDGTHEVVLPTSTVSYLPVNSSNNNQIAGSFAPSPVRRDLDSYPAYCEWTSHVLGSDTLLLTAPSSQSVIYQLTSSDEFIITGKIKNFHAIAPFYLNLNNPSADISGHFLQIRCLHPTFYEVIAYQPPTSGSNYNNYNVSHTANSSEDVNSTTNNSSSVTSIGVPLKFDLIAGSFLNILDENASVSGQNAFQNAEQNRIASSAPSSSSSSASSSSSSTSSSSLFVGHSSLIQDAIYTIVPVISCHSNESSTLALTNVSSSNHGESTLREASCETAVASSSRSSYNDSQEPLTPVVRSASSSSSVYSSNSIVHQQQLPPPVLLLTLSYGGRSIEMSLQSNSNSSNSSNYNNGTQGNNLLTNNLMHLPFSFNGSSSSSCHASSSNSSTYGVSSVSTGITTSSPFDSVKLRVRIRKDGISFMPVGMNDFKCIYKVKW